MTKNQTNLNFQEKLRKLFTYHRDGVQYMPEHKISEVAELVAETAEEVVEKLWFYGETDFQLGYSKCLENIKQAMQKEFGVGKLV